MSCFSSLKLFYVKIEYNNNIKTYFYPNVLITES